MPELLLKASQSLISRLHHSPRLRPFTLFHDSHSPFFNSISSTHKEDRRLEKAFGEQGRVARSVGLRSNPGRPKDSELPPAFTTCGASACLLPRLCSLTSRFSVFCRLLAVTLPGFLSLSPPEIWHLIAMVLQIQPLLRALKCSLRCRGARRRELHSTSCNG